MIDQPRFRHRYTMRLINTIIALLPLMTALGCDPEPQDSALLEVVERDLPCTWEPGEGCFCGEEPYALEFPGIACGLPEECEDFEIPYMLGEHCTCSDSGEGITRVDESFCEEPAAMPELVL